MQFQRVNRSLCLFKSTKIAQKLCSKRLFVPFCCLNWHVSGKNDLFCRDWHEYVFSAEVIPRVLSSLNIIIRNDSGQEKLSREAKLEDDDGLLARRPKEGMGMGETRHMMRLALHYAIFSDFYESVMNGPTDRRTDGLMN